MRFPFEKVSRMEGVRAELKETTEFPRRCSRPEGEFLHEGRLFVSYQLFEVGIKGRKLRMRGDGVEGCVIAMVSLVFPDMNYEFEISPT